MSITARDFTSLTCPITGQTFVDPYMSMNCGHSFEHEAILQQIKEEAPCPTCKKNITTICANTPLQRLIRKAGELATSTLVERQGYLRKTTTRLLKETEEAGLFLDEKKPLNDYPTHLNVPPFEISIDGIKRPVVNRECAHLFDESVFNKALVTTPLCPACNIKISRESLVPNKTLQAAIEEFPVLIKDKLQTTQQPEITTIIRLEQLLLENQIREQFTDFKCPITHEIMQTPVVVFCCGQFFEWESLHKWVQQKDSCPSCRSSDVKYGEVVFFKKFINNVPSTLLKITQSRHPKNFFSLKITAKLLHLQDMVYDRQQIKTQLHQIQKQTLELKGVEFALIDQKVAPEDLTSENEHKVLSTEALIRELEFHTYFNCLKIPVTHIDRSSEQVCGQMLDASNLPTTCPKCDKEPKKETLLTLRNLQSALEQASEICIQELLQKEPLVCERITKILQKTAQLRKELNDLPYTSDDLREARLALLHLAIKKGEEAIALEQIESLNSKDLGYSPQHSKTALLTALHYGRKAVAGKLIDKMLPEDLLLNPKWENKSEDGIDASALHYAILNHYNLLAEQMITKLTPDALSCTNTPYHGTVLHCAIEYGLQEIALKLIDHMHPEDLYQTRANGQSPLQIAQTLGRSKIVENLLIKQKEL